MRRNAKSEQIGQNSVYYHRLLLAGLTFKGDSLRPPPPPMEGNYLTKGRGGLALLSLARLRTPLRLA